MWKALGGWYSHRVVNVNVNIVAAAVLALLPTLLAVHATELWLANPHPDEFSRRLAARDKLVISVVTFVVDVVSDFFIYYALHFVANHLPNRLKYHSHDPQHTHVPFLKDATLVQFQRMVLSPLLYLIWLGSQQVLMHVFDLTSVWATGVGCVIAVGTIRCIHTWWMIKAEAKKRIKQGAKFLHDLTPHGRSHPHLQAEPAGKTGPGGSASAPGATNSAAANGAGSQGISEKAKSPAA